MLASVACKECGNDLWDVFKDQAKCTNCGFKRPYIQRKGHSGKLSPTQNDAISIIRRYFNGQAYRRSGKLELEITFQDNTGYAYVNVSTHEDPRLASGGHFCIGRRGGIRVLSVWDIWEDKDEIAKHYAKMLGGKVGW